MKGGMVGRAIRSSVHQHTLQISKLVLTSPQISRLGIASPTHIRFLYKLLGLPLS